MITIQQLREIMPGIGGRATLFAGPINATMVEFGIDTPARQSAFLAQLAHESGQFRYMEEIASGAAYDHRADLGNTRPEAIAAALRHGSTPGRWWKGHGPIQITGYDNHRACSIALFGDESILIEDPRMISTPEEGCRAAGWFWKTNHLNHWADLGDIDGVSDVINRGRKTAKEGDANGYAERLAFFGRASEVLA